MNAHRSGIVAVVGRPNVGKSTLVNALVGEKVAIVSDKPQTTRADIRAILSTDAAQIVFTDTPGFHKPRTLLGSRLNELVADAVDGVDVVILVVDGSAGVGRGDGVERLRELILARMPEGPPLFPVDEVTDQPLETRVAELIREQALRVTREEVPHSVAIEIDEMEREGDLTRIHASIVVERDSQKGILIGKGGATLKTIGTEARAEIVRLLGTKVYLDLHVKVLKDWQRDPKALNRLGY